MKKLGCIIGIAGKNNLSIDKFLFKVERAILGGISVFQLREKNKKKEEIIKIAKEVKKLCSAYDVRFIVNDDPLIAKIVDADGVHIGKTDFEIGNARKILGKNKIIGTSCYNSLERAIEMQRKGADYVSFSSPFFSPSKPDKTLSSFEIFEKAAKILKVKIYAIGGITDKNVSIIMKTGIYGVACMSFIFEKEDPFFPAFSLKEKISRDKSD